MDRACQMESNGYAFVGQRWKNMNKVKQSFLVLWGLDLRKDFYSKTILKLLVSIMTKKKKKKKKKKKN